MAIFGSPSASQKSESPSPAPAQDPPRTQEKRAEPASFSTPAPRSEPAPAPRASAEVKESVIAADLTIEGKIEGSGHVRLAGKFKGDVNVQGDLTIEVGAKLNGGVKARKVIIAGELEGNIDAAERVELLQSGAMVGDIKAGTVNVASGARMRGQVEFGWGKEGHKANGKGNGAAENGSAS